MCTKLFPIDIDAASPGYVEQLQVMLNNEKPLFLTPEMKRAGSLTFGYDPDYCQLSAYWPHYQWSVIVPWLLEGLVLKKLSLFSILSKTFHICLKSATSQFCDHLTLTIVKVIPERKISHSFHLRCENKEFPSKKINCLLTVHVVSGYKKFIKECLPRNRRTSVGNIFCGNIDVRDICLHRLKWVTLFIHSYTLNW